MKIVCAPVGPLQANCYLVSDDEGVTCVIDPGGEAERLVQIMEKRGLVCGKSSSRTATSITWAELRISPV